MSEISDLRKGRVRAQRIRQPPAYGPKEFRQALNTENRSVFLF